MWSTRNIKTGKSMFTYAFYAFYLDESCFFVLLELQVRRWCVYWNNILFEYAPSSQIATEWDFSNKKLARSKMARFRHRRLARRGRGRRRAAHSDKLRRNTASVCATRTSSDIRTELCSLYAAEAAFYIFLTFFNCLRPVNSGRSIC